MSLAIDAALHHVAGRGDLPAVQRLLAAGASATAGLLPAALAGDTKIVRALLEAGADAGVVDVDGLFWMSHCSPAVPLLLAAGAAAGRRTLQLAANSNAVDVVRMLLDAGVPTDDVSLEVPARNRWLDVMRLLLFAGANPDTGLRSALEFQCHDIAQLLVDMGAVPAVVTD